MQVHELAKTVGADLSAVKEFLGVTSHLSKVSDDDAKRVIEKFGESTPSAPAQKKPSNVVRLWSENRTHRIAATTGELIIMENFQLTVEKGSDIYNEIKRSGDAEVRLVVDKPFKSPATRAAFAEFLSERCITDQGKQSLFDGLDWVKALFYPSELVEVASLLQTDSGLKGVIQLAVDTKSYTTL